MKATMHPVRFLLMALLCALPTIPSADVDGFPEYWYLIGKDSTLVVAPDGAVAEMASTEALEHSRLMDSICDLGTDHRCVLNYHIGACDTKKIQWLKDYFKKYDMTVAAVGCRNPEKQLKIFRVKNTLPFKFPYSKLALRFKEANEDPDYYRNRKTKMEKSKKAYQAWERSPQGMAYLDSLRKGHSANPMLRQFAPGKEPPGQK